MEYKRKMMDNELEAAKIIAEAAAEEEDIEFQPAEPGSSKVIDDRMHQYLDDYNMQFSDSMKIVEPVRQYVPVADKRDLPKVELSSFDGDPVKYWKFIQQFTYYVERKEQDDGQRLLYLIYYCRGSAREAIDECVGLPPSAGYARARNILERLFGQRHRVARAIIDGILPDDKVVRNTPDSLERLSIKMENCEIALTQMHYLANLNSTDTTEMVVRALPIHLQREWAKVAYHTTSEGQEPTFHQLSIFVSECAGILRSRFGHLANESEVKTRSSRLQSSRHDQTRRFSDPLRSTYFTNLLTESSPLCPSCNTAHEIDSCTKFQSLDMENRWQLIKQSGRCFACLKPSHVISRCTLKVRCGIDGCKSFHNRLLHANSTATSITTSGLGICGATCVTKMPRLGIIPVELETPVGVVRTCAFVDNGSDVTLVKRSFLHNCGIPGTMSTLTVATVSGVTTTSCVKTCLKIRSVGGDEEISVDNVYSVPDLPMRSVKSIRNEAIKWRHLSGIQFPDVLEDEVTILLGCDVPEAHWVLDQKVGDRRQPFAVRTVLGWMLCGPLNYETQEQSHVYLLSQTEAAIGEQIQAMYNTEFGDTSVIDQVPSKEDELALAMVQSTALDDENHFLVPLPWKASRSYLENNRNAVLHRLNLLKRKFLRDPVLFDNYSKVIERHIQRGYLERFEPETTIYNSPRWYLPHHAVFHKKKPGKIRVVFDCAAKFRGSSLNDALYQGPDLNTSLINVMMRFRLEKIAVSADIEEMFLQVRIPATDRSMFRILWWPERDLAMEPVEYRLTVHPFGASSSPFCATFALRTTVDTFQSMYAKSTSEAVRNNFYVDDCLVSMASVADAICFVREVTELLSKGGFRLRNWMSNNREVLMSIPASELSPSIVNFSTTPIPAQRTLGIQWNADEDTFGINFEFPAKPVTRRGILSCISSLYDPLGFVSPWLLPGKQLLQRLSKGSFDWDEPIVAEEELCWLSWIDSLGKLGGLRIPRCLKPLEDIVLNTTELHIFCDASEVGYGVVAYGCFTSRSGERHSTLLYSKARVAPSKVVSIPRLELVAAVLAARVRELIGKAIGQTFQNVYFWTDSTIVLYYIHDTSSRFCTFIANRLTTIHQASTPTQWSHVPSESNPADLTSRGASNNSKLDSWLHGPDFLKQTCSAWPQKPKQFVEPQDVEYKTTRQVHATCKANSISELFTRYSDWTRLRRSIAWLIRFKSYWLERTGHRPKASTRTGQLRVDELRFAERNIIKIVQAECFHDEISRLSQGNPKHADALRRSRLKNLCPFIVEDTLRVGGRLSESSYDEDCKHPIILPKRHHVVEILIRHYHLLEGHCGPSQVLSSIRERFWIIDGMSAVKRTLKYCTICHRMNTPMGSQLMAPLPTVRVEPGWHAFSNVGLDYFGPFFVKRGRGLEKRYGCLFTCLQSRAIHIEVAHSLTADSFMMCLTRFVARRGKPDIVYSDNGTNFVAVDKQLKAWLRSTETESFIDKLVNKGIEWHFNPPYASHRGGVWERLIRSVRRILNTVGRQQTMSDETLSTLLTESERILNNRPLIKASSVDSAKVALTPNDLLIFKSNLGLTPDTTVTQIYSHGWKCVQHLVSSFWKRWSREYIQLLQSRQRWIKRMRNFNVGDVVIVASEGLNRTRWPLGIICKCEVDPDGLVRTVELKVNGSVLRRDIRNICLIEGVEDVVEEEQRDTPATELTTANNSTSNSPSRSIDSKEMCGRPIV